MNTTTKRSMALLLVLLQLCALLPALSVQADAADASESPVLNEMIVGAFAFQSFNFLGDNASGSDGVDYTSTFYYTDDWFSDSAINENATSTTMKWSDLENVSLAATSFDLTVAAYASNEGNVLSATSRTWDNTDYSDKAHNAREMLEQCGFTNIRAYQYDHAPTNDSIGFVIASKPIHVWDAYSQQNKDFTLLAVAVRGAGYGAEWASNITIGDKDTNQLPSNGRHWGFDSGAVQVCSAIQQYLQENGITQDAKYWITGFSRAGATANLVAGYVTDGAETIYHTHQRDVYGYTWECPQAAAASENALHYRNIHNIINGMDAVPKVSPDSFNHQRLGVDYYMPYYRNTTGSENETFYANMREVLKTIAVGAYNYKGEYYTEDPLIQITDPSQYPYNRTMRIRTITATKLLSDALDGTLTDNFGTVDATGSDQRIPSQYIDQFIDDLIQVFMVSTVWDRHFSSSTSNILTHRTRFISYYQPHFRNVLGYLLDFTGPAFLGVIDQLLDAVGDQLALTNTVDNIGVGLAFLNFYNYPTSTYKWGVPPFIDPWVGSPGWAGKTRKDVLIEEAQPVVRNVVRNLTGSFVDPQGITRSQFENSMDTMVELIIDLYADELSRYNSNYFGTTLYYLWQILCVHEQEVVMSWIKSLDPMHTNRGYRTLTVPADADVKLYSFRAKYGETLSADGTAPLVAEFENGTELANLDQRILMQTSGSNMIIRYPAALDIRLDVKTDADYNVYPFSVADYQTKTFATALSDGGVQYTKLSDASVYTDITNQTGKTNARTVNAMRMPLTAYDTLRIQANGTSSFDNSGYSDRGHQNSDVYAVDKYTAYPVTWLDEDGETELAKAEYVPGEEPVYPNGTPEKESDAQYDYAFLGWVDEDGALYDDGLPAVTGAAVYTAAFDETLREYTVTWVIDETETTETKHYNEIPSRADPVKPSVGDTIYTFVGWDDGENRYGAGEALPAVTGDVTYTAVFIESQLLNVSYYAEDVQNKHGGEPFALTGGETDSSGVKQQANYPSYMGYALTSVVVESDGHSETVQAQDTNIDLAALNAALRSVTGASGSNQASVTAYYTKQTDQVYRVTVEHALADGTVLSSYTSDDYVVGDAVQIAAPDTKTKDGTTYWFSHWQVGEAQYGTQTITLRPNEAKTYTVRAVYSTEAPTSEAIAVEIQNVYAETQNGKNKIAITMGWSAPGLETIKQAGVRVSLKDPTLTSFSMGTSSNTGNTGSYTLHVNMTGKEDRPLYARAYLIYLDEAGVEHTVLSEPIQTYVWNDLNQIV